MENMLSIINAQIQANNLKTLHKVKIVVGSLTGIVPESLDFCWQICTENSNYAGAALEIEQRQAAALCSKCGREYPLKEDYSCPLCAGGIGQIIAGKELYIDYLEGD